MIRYAVQHTAITTAPITPYANQTLAINLPWFAVARFSNLIADYRQHGTNQDRSRPEQ